ncbi:MULTISPECIES: bifunctional nuclease family protein [unclassified Desulfovibrio]|uniref:bifunctional nuclease family protein n=1 Tax=unclassified Desulfovibrio TaxID=2593640 RepID=UPI001F10F8EE|nr:MULTISPECIES: bifunctional nuclease family protein [unclassified Desulfovibrio]MCH5145448.1 bifunctional nuclease family protein [Desulfovibrio sp. UIB00]HZF60828.1 bifunctional nuclease family protein [Desulfovibrio sp.]
MVEMRVFGLTIDPQSKTPIVVLREASGDAVLPVWVGAMEAMAISLVLNNENLPRPLTHDLFLMTLKAFKAELRRVEINDLREGTFYAVLVLSGPEGRTRVDCRPSDAIALAMRAGAPILVEEEVLRLSAEEQQRAEQSTAVEVTTPIPDAATDMVRRVGAQKEADMLGGALLRHGELPPSLSADEETRYREMLRSLDPISRRKM